MSITAQDALDVFNSIGDTYCHNKVVSAKLIRDFRVSSEQAAQAIEEAIRQGILEMDSLGTLSLP